ncbi:DinB family protein [Ktedonospora formicarum]|uniref:DinB-like domain-containing protein n=1 Tax=Ktedonospora formicarum TaxID=2778364 RepID=A0A8J3MTQ0_9CHLR|nr:DinB family protein [Ktedonospora formicarum]GHO44615.1 hypothetical protein KSX_27780 [Ktedonospora formicarum]
MANMKTLVFIFKRNHDVILMHTSDLTTEESLVLPPDGGNCLNWVLGHVLVHRDISLRLLGAEELLSPSEREVYQRQSEHLSGPERASSLKHLLDLLRISNQRLLAALEQISPEVLVQPSGPDGKRTLGEVLEQLQWHETYHTGQFELLRHVAGKHEKLI